MRIRAGACLLVLLGMSACDSASSDPLADAAAVDDTDAVADVAAPEPWVVTAEDFGCIKDGTKVRNFFVTNKLDLLDEALEVANAPDGGVFPPGTIIQLISLEAMAKHRPGWDPATNDWEFFELEGASDGSTTILSRGAADTVNQFGGNCFGCHAKAAPQWDMLCEQDHGCDDLGLPQVLIEVAQNGDIRCP